MNKRLPLQQPSSSVQNIYGNDSVLPWLAIKLFMASSFYLEPGYHLLLVYFDPLSSSMHYSGTTKPKGKICIRVNREGKGGTQRHGEKFYLPLILTSCLPCFGTHGTLGTIISNFHDNSNEISNVFWHRASNVYILSLLIGLGFLTGNSITILIF